ncbi:peroxide stress protein YaaA [Microbacterium oryzae]|uniref:YaaA family protein n=1 Tax=Microbacterium oryzae TaxID=743009 RepID=UPI0025B247EE|nr:peroxide stress protein YaaA [Microbacterium oryzae]MDN3311475.1 peroxide stress protein YaaA [Microbacterium oryzae]
MLILLPPSETKRPGGDGARLRLADLRLRELVGEREAVADALVALSADPERAARVLKLGARQLGEIERNAALLAAPTMPAVDRYTGVLFDALDAPTLSAGAREWLARHALIHTAPFGPVGASDPIPAYRLAAGAALPGVPPLRRHWAAAASAALGREAGDGLVVDLRSKAYVELGPLPEHVAAVSVSVVAEGADGAVRALNHFNKKAKGRLTRLAAESAAVWETADDLIVWAGSVGLDMRPGGSPREVLLVAE